MYGLTAIEDGLDAPHDPEETEILVVGACIQFLPHGSGIFEELESQAR